MIEMFLFAIILMVEVFKLIIRLSFRFLILCIKAFLKIVSFILSMISLILDLFSKNVNKSPAKEKLPKPRKEELRDWDEIDEYVMYDEILFDEDE